MTGESPEPADDNESADGESQHLLPVRDELFRHRLTLKQHDYRLISTEERLTLTAIQALSQAFLIIAVVTGLGVLAGTPISEAVSILQHVILVFAGFAFFFIGLSSFITSGHGLVETVSRFREGPPEPPSELSELKEEGTGENEQDHAT